MLSASRLAVMEDEGRHRQAGLLSPFKSAAAIEQEPAPTVEAVKNSRGLSQRQAKVNSIVY